MGKFPRSVAIAGFISICFTPCILIGHGGAGILPAGLVVFETLTGKLRLEYLGAALVTIIPVFLILSLLIYFLYDNDLPEPTKSEKKIHDPDKIYELTFDYNKCVNCPVCNAKLKLDESEIERRQFECTDCNSKIKFAVKGA